MKRFFVVGLILAVAISMNVGCSGVDVFLKVDNWKAADEFCKELAKKKADAGDVCFLQIHLAAKDKKKDKEAADALKQIKKKDQAFAALAALEIAAKNYDKAEKLLEQAGKAGQAGLKALAGIYLSGGHGKSKDGKINFDKAALLFLKAGDKAAALAAALKAVADKKYDAAIQVAIETNNEKLLKAVIPVLLATGKFAEAAQVAKATGDKKLAAAAQLAADVQKALAKYQKTKGTKKEKKGLKAFQKAVKKLVAKAKKAGVDQLQDVLKGLTIVAGNDIVQVEVSFK
jgi:hypothetical protein